MEEKLIEIKDISKSFGAVKAVNKVSLDIFKGESLGLVGESGSGKTTLSRMILKLLEPSAGEIIYNFDPDHDFRKSLQIVFQDPQSSLNPRIKIGDAIMEPMLIHSMCSKDQAKKRATELLRLVNLPESYLDRYPHALSGGERQRVGLARALALEPKFLVLDEPVSSLDVAVQVQILKLLKEIKQKLGLTYLFIAHDLAVIGYMCDRIAVMEGGRIVEVGPRDQVLSSPKVEYTQKLLASSLSI